MNDILEVLDLGCAVKLDRSQSVWLGSHISCLEAVNEQLARELSIHEPSTDKLADLAAYCVQRNIGQSGQEAHEAIMAHCDALSDHLSRVLQTYGDNSGFEPSLSVFHREIDLASDYMAKRQGGEK